MRKHVPNSFFSVAADTLRNGTPIKLRVEGNSMVPFIKGGKDLIELIPYQGEELPLWAAVFYKWEGRYMVHRIVKREGDTLYMLGDGNVYQHEVLSEKEIIGVLKTIIHPNGTTTDCLDEKWLKKGRQWNSLHPELRKMALRLCKLIRVLKLM